MTFAPLLDNFQVYGEFIFYKKAVYMRNRYDNRTMLRTTNDIIMSPYFSFFQILLICAVSTIKSSQQQRYFTSFTVLKVMLLALP